MDSSHPCHWAALQLWWQEMKPFLLQSPLLRTRRSVLFSAKKKDSKELCPWSQCGYWVNLDLRCNVSTIGWDDSQGCWVVSVLQSSPQHWNSVAHSPSLHWLWASFILLSHVPIPLYLFPGATYTHILVSSCASGETSLANKSNR